MTKKLFVGIDVGGTKTKVGLITDKGGITAERTILTPTSGKGRNDAGFAWLDQTIREIWDDRVVAIGIGIAGLVDFRRGRFLGGPNLPQAWSKLDLRAAIRRRFRRPTVLDNDAKCFALGEYRFGAGHGAKNLIALTVGTGIGGALIVGGQLVRGRDNGAGEFGHVTVDGSSRLRCACGGYGHWETLAAGPSIRRRYCPGTDCRLKSTEIAALAKNGDQAAAKAIAEAAHWLGIGLASLVQTFNPDRIVVGGGVVQAAGILPAAVREMKRQVAFPAFRQTPIIRSTLGDRANILGAAILAQQ